MISRYRFIKESTRLGITAELAGIFYDSFESMRSIVRRYYPAWEKIPTDDWAKLRQIEGDLQWPVLVVLGDSACEIYTDIDRKKMGEATNFRNSINSEIELRKNRASISEADYESALKFLIQQRFEFLLTIFEVDNKSKWWLAVAAAATAGAGYIAYKKFTTKEDEKK